MIVLLILATAVALLAGAKTERARQAHTMMRSYKSRAATARGTRVREAVRAGIWILALLLLVQALVLHLL